MAVSCAYCSSPNHVWWDCPKKPDGWKPDNPFRSRAMHLVSTRGSKPIPVNVALLDASGATPLKRGRGRPKSITDMCAYKAEKAKAYRARLKLAKPNEDQK